jgi:hypothetical protein
VKPSSGPYVADLQARCSDGVVLVLVPQRRIEEINSSVAKMLSAGDAGPWQLNEPSVCSVAVITWEDVLDTLAAVSSEPFSGDLAQFQAMYRVFERL